MVYLPGVWHEVIMGNPSSTRETEAQRKERVGRQWQHAFGWLDQGEAERWWEPIVGLAGMVAQAQTSTIILQKRNLSTFPEIVAKEACFRVMPRLVGNACRVAKEINSLLWYGFPEGALGRWRTLHEISLIALLVATSDRSLAERYEAHLVIQHHKMMERSAELYKSQGFPPSAELPEIQRAIGAERRRLIEKYGARFKNDYGWAEPEVSGKGNRGPRIDDIEKNLGMGHMRLVYAIASDQIHSNPGSVPWHLDPSEGDHFDRLFGPVTDGLAAPGILTAFSLRDVMLAWEFVNRTGNPFLSPTYDDDRQKAISDKAANVAHEFVDQEKDLECLLKTGVIMSILTAHAPSDPLGNGDNPDTTSSPE